jgi:hypothetical protein
VKPAHFDFFTINFTVWSHILSTVGDAKAKTNLQKKFHLEKGTLKGNFLAHPSDVAPLSS